jgi:hypothetical protein
MESRRRWRTLIEIVDAFVFSILDLNLRVLGSWPSQLSQIRSNQIKSTTVTTLVPCHSAKTRRTIIMQLATFSRTVDDSLLDLRVHTIMPAFRLGFPWLNLLDC